MSPRAVSRLLSGYWHTEHREKEREYREGITALFTDYMPGLNETLLILPLALSYWDVTHNEDVTGHKWLTGRLDY